MVASDSRPWTRLPLSQYSSSLVWTRQLTEVALFPDKGTTVRGNGSLIHTRLPLSPYNGSLVQMRLGQWQSYLLLWSLCQLSSLVVHLHHCCPFMTSTLTHLGNVDQRVTLL